ncbi:hypothetical protein [Rhodococcus sp. UNC363MFTsu5.1]|uniref:hypothetical protein n=1 Tax=Rhodococcus sp. UNC363MFTsu5.1 TaxID=1449069 RepID=UPI0012DF6540|nr:hypothetical protein [Rhodococcus sp. UNC363MFTsu5.1]
MSNPTALMNARLIVGGPTLVVLSAVDALLCLAQQAVATLVRALLAQLAVQG